MTADQSPLVALLCDEPSTLRTALSIHLERAGFTIAGTYDRGTELLTAADLDPDVIVLDLVLAGPLGTRFVAALRSAFPRSAILVFVPLPPLASPALAAGADDVFADTDLRRFARVVAGLTERLRTPVGREA